MTTQTTQPPAVTDQVVEQQAAVRVLLDLIGQHPELPAPYIVIHTPSVGYQEPARLNLQLDDPHSFEQWRRTLDIQPSGITFHTTASYSWLAVDFQRDGVSLHLVGFTATLPAQRAHEPRDRNEVSA
ncbi:hypothetical protein [Streptomyces pseudovenezuelae]|uniref:hypothetical protein n=1 Tax=Streptomyces pseudovenezuelae TaxID=67350 RepID=UPI0036E31CE4